jgi:hypothetical protein
MEQTEKFNKIIDEFFHARVMAYLD